jgi:hypothetical protein
MFFQGVEACLEGRRASEDSGFVGKESCIVLARAFVKVLYFVKHLIKNRLESLGIFTIRFDQHQLILCEDPVSGLVVGQGNVRVFTYSASKFDVHSFFK